MSHRILGSELDFIPYLLGHQGSIMLATNLRTVAHQLAGLIQTDAVLREMAAEGMTEVEAGPRQPMSFVRFSNLDRDIIGMPTTAGRRSKEPRAIRAGTVLRQDCMKCFADRNCSVLAGLRFPVLTLDLLRHYSDDTLLKIDIILRQPTNRNPNR